MGFKVMEVRKQGFEGEILHGCQKNSSGGRKRVMIGILIQERNDMRCIFSLKIADNRPLMKGWDNPGIHREQVIKY